MGVNGGPVAPTLDNKIDPTPKRQIHPIKGRKVSEQAHPKSGQGLVVEVIDPVMPGERDNRLPHPS